MHKFEEDFIIFVNYNRKTKHRYNEFKEFYEDFLTQIKDNNELGSVSLNLSDNFINTTKMKKIGKMLSFIESTNYVNFSYKTIKRKTMQFGLQYGLNIMPINNISDFKSFCITIKTLLSTDLKLLNLLLYVFKIEVINSSEKIISTTVKIDNAKNDFLDYYNKVVKREIIDDELTYNVIEHINSECFGIECGNSTTKKII